MHISQHRAQFIESLVMVSRKLRTSFNGRVMAHGLTFPRARALARLAKRSGMTQSELACELELEKPTLVRLLDRMEALDLITREPNAEDRRVKHVVLTSHGRAQADLVHSIGERLREEILEGIPEEDLTRAIALFEQIASRLEAMGEAPSDG